MPKFDISNSLETVDETADIIENIYTAYSNSGPTPEEIKDCYNDIGGSHGYQDGYGYVDANLSGIVTPEPQPSVFDAAPVCDGIVAPATDNDFFLPSFTNPFLAAAEVALTPTEVASGTVYTPGADGTYYGAYQDGFQAGAVDAFDAHLDSRFQATFEPTVPPVEPDINTPAAALDFSAPFHSDDNSSTFDTSSGGSSGGYDSGSSGGDSSVSSD